MANPLRRVLSARNLLLLRSSIARSRRELSFPSSSTSSICNFVSESSAFFGGNGVSDRVGLGFLRESRRGFAKGRKSKGDGDDAGTVEVVPDIGPTVKATATSQMDAAIAALSRDLSKIRTGRASAGMLDHIIVETGGVKMSLNRVAVVSVLESQTLSVTPYDPNHGEGVGGGDCKLVVLWSVVSSAQQHKYLMLKSLSLAWIKSLCNGEACQIIKELENAIVSSPLGLNPQVDGQRLIVAIPRLTKEHVQAMCKVVTKSCEDVKQSIRRARQKAFDTIKKAASSMAKDDVKRLEKEVEELTKKIIKSAEDMCKLKEKEITGN